MDFFCEAMDLLDDAMDLLFVADSRKLAQRFSSGHVRHGCRVSKDDDDAMHLELAMPGLGKEHVKLSAEKNILVIKGKGDKDPDDSKAPVRYSRRIQLLPADGFRMDQIKAEMSNGVLKVTVPKIKDEEREDLFQVKVE